MKEKEKLLSVVVPCYNSAAYMEHAVNTLLSGGEEMDIMIVDDGSAKDNTFEIAKRLESEHPGLVRAFHKENGGHGSAVNMGIENAVGTYFKVVDSDDWVNEDCLKKVLERLKELLSKEMGPDMFLCNYVYEKVGEKTPKVISYRGKLPIEKTFYWDEAKRFGVGEYILMHSVIYRTTLLKECGLKLPEHTFYVDNIYVYQPLPHVKTLYYMDLDLYRYFIGRDDQSVSTKNMMARVDQQLFVTRTMVDLYDLEKVGHKHLANYMLRYLIIMMMISSVFLVLRKDEESIKKKNELWDYVKEKDPVLYKKMSRSFLGACAKVRTPLGRAILCNGYKLSRKIFKFN
ncbi:MAG: glycosyltransferase family 2 protein [Lachnospiraceae bacterium]|nr:glycosyltransferase family 2 protein [Lachnospiraceae bacterium]